MSEQIQTDSGDETDTETGPKPDRGESPGRMLKAARERKGLSVDELVAETALSPATLAALEADDFERLSQPVFVRGYYRKCAKILDLPEEELLAAYVAHAGVREGSREPLDQLDVIPQDVTPHHWLGPGLVLAVFSVLGVLLLVWWLMAGDAADTVGERSAAVPAAEDGGTEIESGGDAAEAFEAPIAETEATAFSEDEAAAGANEPEARLQLRFKTRSWVEVRDAGGERLLQDIVPAGGERTVVGRAPYEVLLGNAPGVEVRLDGERVSFENRIRSDNTARITVAKDAAE